MDNLINLKSVKNRINAINTKLSDNARLLSNTDNLIPNYILIMRDKSNKWSIQERYNTDTSKDRELILDDYSSYLSNIKDIQIKNNLSKPFILKVDILRDLCN